MIFSTTSSWTIPFWRGSLLMLELCGAGIIIWKGVPLYRELLAGTFSEARPVVKWWLVVAIALIQMGFWSRHAHQALPRLPRQVLLGHVTMFFARLNFIFAGAVFSAVFYLRYDLVTFSPIGSGLLLLILFSMFCVTIDCERIGLAFVNGESSGNRPDSKGE